MVAHTLRSAGIAGWESTSRQSGRVGVALLIAALLSGCASFSGDRGMDAVSGIVTPALKADVVALNSDEDFASADWSVAALLKRPLGPDAAVQIALLKNRDLQAAYNELDIAEAARVRASMPPNPKFSLSRMAGGGGFEIESRSIFARAYISRFTSLSLVICPSVWTFDQGLALAAQIATLSLMIPRAKQQMISSPPLATGQYAGPFQAAVNIFLREWIRRSASLG